MIRNANKHSFFVKKINLIIFIKTVPKAYAMSGTPVEIHWFPATNDRFLTWGSEINLYQVKNITDIDHRVPTSAYCYCTIVNVKFS